LTTYTTITSLLGKNFGNTKFIKSRVRAVELKTDMRITNIDFTNEQGTTIPAIQLQPINQNAAAPAILYCHAHGFDYSTGRRELLAGRKALSQPYAHDLVALGYQVLCIDMPCFGERQHLHESATAKSCLWRGNTLFGWMLSELMAAVSYLADQPFVDANRIATLGISMGGTHAWWLAALDARISASVALCCFADLNRLIEHNLHDYHGHYMSVPDLLSHTSTGRLAGLACPKPQFFGIGLQDPSTPASCFELARQEVLAAYSEQGAADQLKFYVESDLAHQESAGMRDHALRFLQRYL